MAFTSERQEFSAGEELITQGKKARAAYLLLRGQARLLRSGQEIGTAEPGAILGENAMIGAGNYAITAVASETVSTARISHELFNKVAREYPEFGQRVIQNLSEKLQGSLRELEAVRILLSRARNFSEL